VPPPLQPATVSAKAASKTEPAVLVTLINVPSNSCVPGRVDLAVTTAYPSITAGGRRCVQIPKIHHFLGIDGPRLWPHS
jgi:hypothetical protein